MKKYIYIVILSFISMTSTFAQYGMLGEVRVFAGNFAPLDWAFCDGQLLSINDYPTLFAVIGTTYGGDGVNTFAVPDLRSKAVVDMGQGAGLSNYTLGQTGGSNTITYTEANLPSHSHTVTINSSTDAADKDTPEGNFAGTTTSATTYQTTANATMGANSLAVTTGVSGSSIPQNNMQPYVAINYIICTTGTYNYIENRYIGEVKLIASPQIPDGWHVCDGSTLPTAQNAALQSLLHYYYGGDGTINFALPDLRSRVPISRGTNASTGTAYALASKGGTEAETINASQMAAHNHTGTVATNKVYAGLGNANTPENNYPAINPQRGNEFTSTSSASTASAPITTDAKGSGVPVDNRQSFATLQYIIAIVGIYPSSSK